MIISKEEDMNHFMGRAIPDISVEDRRRLGSIYQMSKKSGELRDIAYAVMNRTLKGANYQKNGVALKGVSKLTGNAIGPITICSDDLDDGNVIELAIDPKKLAETLGMNYIDTNAWLCDLQEHLCHRAKPKTSQQYERVGVRNENELCLLIDAWEALISNRRWPIPNPEKGSDDEVTSEQQSASAADPLITTEEPAVAASIESIFDQPEDNPMLGMLYPDELPQEAAYLEGLGKQVLVNKYERSQEARNACISHYSCACQVCELDFGEMYGDLGAGFIHVHHKEPIASIRSEYIVDPVKDLVPVCPNCHAMLHRREPPLDIDELRDLMQDR